MCHRGKTERLQRAGRSRKFGGHTKSVVDDVNDSNSVSPGEKITYTVTFDATLTNIEITDYLPYSVDCNEPYDPNYNSAYHTYTWDIGTPGPNDSNLVELTVVVNGSAEPLGTITNACVIDANEIEAATAIEVTDVNCWDYGIIYVDEAATTGLHTGLSWQNAYTDLYSAVARANQGCGNQILVSEGTYYGGLEFRDNSVTLRSTDPNDWDTVVNTVIYTPNEAVPLVDFNNCPDSVLAGLTVRGGAVDGVQGKSDASIGQPRAGRQENVAMKPGQSHLGDPGS